VPTHLACEAESMHTYACRVLLTGSSALAIDPPKRKFGMYILKHG